MKAQNQQQPLVGIICDREMLGPHSFHIAGDKYIQAISQGSQCLPVLIPASADESQIDALLNIVDGVLLTGGYSMVDPLNYQSEGAEQGTKLDINRDQTSLPLVNKAVAMGIPLLGICRGFQEMNVALGGSLHQKLHENGHYIEHRENKDLALAEQYAGRHQINLLEHGHLMAVLEKSSTQVNSLHTQGVDKLADALTIEALAEDGLVEAFSVTSATTFALAVQWHPEWQFQNNPDSVKLFHAFGQACKARQQMGKK